MKLSFSIKTLVDSLINYSIFNSTILPTNKPLKNFLFSISIIIAIVLSSANLYAKDTKIFKYTEPLVFELGGNTSISGWFTEEEKHFEVSFAPSFSSFITKGFAIGGAPLLSFEYISRKCECSNSTDIVKKPLGGGLEVFFTYVFDLNHAIFPFISISQGFIFSEELKSDINSNRFFVGPDIGIKIIFRENGILNIFLRYQFNSTGYENKDDREEKHFIAFGTGLGFWF